MTHITGHYYWVEGNDRLPGSLVLATLDGDTIIENRRVTILEEAATLDEAHHLVAEWESAR